MGFLGSLQNGSPFNIGYEYTAPELTAPTALASLAKLYDADATAKTTTTKKDSSTSTDGTTTSLVVPGTQGTTDTIIGAMDGIDAEIASVKAKMRKNFNRDVSATPEIAVQKSADLAKQLGTLIAYKNKTKMLTSVSNQNLIDVETAFKPYEKNPSTLSEKAMQLVDGIYMPLTDETGKMLTYGGAKSLAYKADNTVKDANGMPVDVNLPDYSALSMGVEQSGALDAKVDAVYKLAVPSKTAYSGENLETATESDLAGFIKGYAGNSNETALLAVAGAIKKKLQPPELADLAAQTSSLVENADTNKDEITKAGLTNVEIAAVDKSNKTPLNLTTVEKESVKSAQDKVLAAKVKGDIGLYRDNAFGTSLSTGLHGSGKYTAPTELTSSPKTIKIDGKDVEGNSWELSNSGLTVPITSEVAAYDTNTGELLSGNKDIKAGIYKIIAYQEVKGAGDKVQSYAVLEDPNDATKVYRVITPYATALSTLKNFSKANNLTFVGSNVFGEPVKGANGTTTTDDGSNMN